MPQDAWFRSLHSIFFKTRFFFRPLSLLPFFFLFFTKDACVFRIICVRVYEKK